MKYVFIIGPPRSGTTLIYQQLINVYNFNYIDNISNYFLPFGFFFQRLRKTSLIGKKAIPLSSKFGKISGLFNPSEAANLWYKWYPRKSDVVCGSDFLNDKQVKKMRSYFNNLLSNTPTSTIFKNTYNSNRLLSLKKVFPDSFFIVCYRNPVDIGQSIYNARRINNLSITDWWSLMPKEYSKIKDGNVFEQISQQIFFTYNQIDKDLSSLKLNEDYLITDYDVFCKNHSHELSRQGLIFKKNRIIPSGVNTSNFTLKYQPKLKGGLKIPMNEYELLSKEINKYFVSSRDINSPLNSLNSSFKK